MGITEYSELGFSNNFMFGKLMENPERCKRFLEQILGLRIQNIKYVEKEKTLEEKYDGRGIRLDIYVDDGKTIYNCEMQTSNIGNLPKRSRYYQSKIDINSLKKGEDYNLLKKSYVIFICTFDPYGKNQYIYTFENMCREETGVFLGDETIKIFINTKGSVGDISEEYKELLRFIDSSQDRYYNNKLANDLLSDLKKARSNEEWRHDYMTWVDYGNECRAEGRAEGRADNVEAMLRKGRTPEEIADFCGYELSYVKEVQKKLLVEA